MKAFEGSFKGLVAVIGLASTAFAQADAGIPAYSLMLSASDGGLDVELPPSIPVDRPFELVAWVPDDVADVSAVYWRSGRWGKDACERNDLDPNEEPALPLKTRFTNGTERRLSEKRLVVLVPKLSQPWWDHCFRLMFWRRVESGNFAQPAQLAQFASQLDGLEGLDGGTSELVIARKAAIASGLFEQQVCHRQGQWADQLSCERTLNEAAAQLLERITIRRIVEAALALKKDLTKLNGIDPSSPGYVTWVASLFAKTDEGRRLLDGGVPDAGRREADLADAGTRRAKAIQGFDDFFGPSEQEKKELAVKADEVVGEIERDLAATQSAQVTFEFVEAGEKFNEFAKGAAADAGVSDLLAERACVPAENKVFLDERKKVLDSTLTKAKDRAISRFDACDAGDCVKALLPLADVRALAGAVVQNTKELECAEANALRAQVRAQTRALEKALAEAAVGLQAESIHIVAPYAGAKGAGAPLHVDRALGFFSTDVGLGALVTNFGPSDPGAVVPVAFVQVAMSLGRVDFDNGIGAVKPPRKTNAFKWLAWQLGQRLSLNIGLIVNLRPIRSPEGQLTGLFGGTSALGTFGAGIRLTEFLKVNAAVVIGTTQPDLPGTGASFHAMPMFGISLDLPVYRLVGKAFTPVFGPLADLPTAPVPSAPAAGGGSP